LDDSLGEAFDKTAPLLGLPLGGGEGGSAVNVLAKEGNYTAVPPYNNSTAKKDRL
jgi:N6-L-threonylcarbamoyladenine synthase